MKKRLFYSLLVLVMCLVAIDVTAEPVKLKFASFAPPKAVSNTIVFDPWIQKMNAGGTVKIDRFTGGILGRGGLIYKNLQDGVADISFMVQAWIAGQFPDDFVLHLPFLAESCAESSMATYSMYKRGLLRGYEDIKPLAVFATGAYYIQSSYPIRKPEDLIGKKFALSSNFHATVLKDLGAIGVGMPSPKVAENMSRGIVEGWISDMSALFAFRVNDVAKYHLLLPFGNSTLLVAMNKKVYGNLPADAKATIDSNSGELLVHAWSKMIDEQVKEKIALLQKDPKHTVVIPTAAELEQWKKSIQPVIDKWVQADPRRSMLIKAYREELDRIRAGN